MSKPMMSQPTLLSGTELAKAIVAESDHRARKITELSGRAPCLATVLVGEDPASVTYVQMKRNRCAQAGIESRMVTRSADISTAELIDTITALSEDSTVDGILVQHPVGPGIDERAAFEAIAPTKDVDGVTLASFAAMSFGLPGFTSCTPGGIMRLLDHYEVDLAGKHAVVVGRSAILGKPVGMLLLEQNATVMFCHSRTKDLDSMINSADVLIAAVGKPEFIRGETLKPGAIVVDAGYHPSTSSGSGVSASGRGVGDVHFESAAARASMITPVPGGVGPMTIALLLEQTVDAASRQLGLDI